MIAPGTKMRLARVPLCHIVVTERGAMNLSRVVFYVGRLEAAPAHELSPVHLVPFTPDVNGSGAAQGGGTKAPDAGVWQLVDGRHRVVASLIAGRESVLALLLSEPGWPGHDARSRVDGWQDVTVTPAAAAGELEREMATATATAHSV